MCVLAGDFAAIKAEGGATKLFNSEAFALNRPLQKKVQAAYAEVWRQRLASKPLPQLGGRSLVSVCKGRLNLHSNPPHPHLSRNPT